MRNNEEWLSTALTIFISSTLGSILVNLRLFVKVKFVKVKVKVKYVKLKLKLNFVKWSAFSVSCELSWHAF